MLGQFGLGGRLADNIRERQGMAYYAFSTLDPSAGEAPLLIRAGVDPANVERAVAAIDHEVRTLAADGPTATELDETRAYLVGSIPRLLETNQSIAAFLQTSEEYGLGLDFDQRLPALLRRRHARADSRRRRRSARPGRRGRRRRRSVGTTRPMTRAVFFDVDFTLIHPGRVVSGHRLPRFLRPARHRRRRGTVRQRRRRGLVGSRRAMAKLYDPAGLHRLHQADHRGAWAAAATRVDARGARHLRRVVRLPSLHALRRCARRAAASSRAPASRSGSSRTRSAASPRSRPISARRPVHGRGLVRRSRLHEAASEHLQAALTQAGRDRRTSR